MSPLPLLLFVLTFISSVHPCNLHGADSGYCTDLTRNQENWKEEYMPFCQHAVAYPACIPKEQSLPPSREFPDGRWSNITLKVSQKDKWIEEMFKLHIFERENIEKSKDLRSKQINEWGDEGKVVERFYKNHDCQDAFRNYFCWINFPRCDIRGAAQETFPTCKSACENFFIACQYDRDLWRCGKSKWFNGYAPEQPIADPISGSVTYLRDYFPGQPFRANKFSLKGNDLVVCTPSIQGSANSNLNLGYQAVLSTVIIVYLSFTLYI